MDSWLAELGDWGKVIFSGPDRKKFLHGLLTNDILALRSGDHCSACLLTPKGMLLADMELYDRGEDILALLQRKALPNLLGALSKRIILSDARMQDASAEPLYLVSKPGCAGLPYEKLGPGGVFLFGQPGAWKELLAQGCVPLSPEALDALRIERGVPLFGVDIGADTIPLEAGLESAISFTKGCYMGQETITRIKDRGHVNKLLVRLKFEGRQPPPPGAVLVDGVPAGRLTSAAWSPAKQAVFGLATVSAAHSKTGTKVSVASIAAEVLD